jgi:glycerophosphoryl diester phosphodiesterase
MGFFSNIIKKVGGFVASVFRDVEKPVKETEKTVKETAKVFEDTGLKAFRGFQKFIEAPIEVEEEREEPEEIKKELIRKIVKTTGYSFGKKETLYALTFEDNDINRFNELREKIIDEFSNSHGILERFGYDSEYATYAEFEYPEIEVGTE